MGYTICCYTQCSKIHTKMQFKSHHTVCLNIVLSFFKRSGCEGVKNIFHPMLIFVFEVIVQLLIHAIRNCTIFRFFSPMCATSSAFLLSTYALSVPHLGHLCLHTAQCGLKSEIFSKKVDFSTVFPFLIYSEML